MIVRLMLMALLAVALGLILRALDVNWPWDAFVIVPVIVLAGRFLFMRGPDAA